MAKKKKEVKKTTFKDWRTQIIILIVFMIIGGGFWYFIDQQPRIPNGARSYVNDYTKYLKRVSGSSDDINVYLEKANDKQMSTHYITVYNKTEGFYCGTLELVDSKNEVIYSRKFVNIRPAEVRIVGIQVNKEPVDYRLKESLFFSYSYPEIESKGFVSNDNDPSLGYAWTNVVFEDEDFTIENCMAYAKNIFVQDVLAGMPSNDVYFYKTSTVEYIEEDGIKFPRTSSNTYVAALDQNSKSVYLAEIVNGNAEIIATEIVK
jgi:hypothetical protein